MHYSIHRVAVRAPFDFRRTLSFACSFSPMQGEQEAHEGRLVKAFSVGGQSVLVRAETAPGRALDLTLDSDTPLDAHAVQRVVERVRFVLSLDDDLTPFYARATSDASLAPVVRALHGMHHLKFPSAFEITCWAILVQRTPIPVARAIKRALTARWGGAVTRGAGMHRTFPDAARIAALAPAELAELVPSARKVEQLRTIAEAFASIDADAHLRALPFGQAEDWLDALPGIGPWSKAFILFRGLGRMEHATLEGPLLDCARRVYGTRPSIAELERIADGYGADVGLWALYLRVGAGAAAAAPRRAAAAG